MECYLIRHAQTQANCDKRYAGRTDIPISREGEQSARQMGVFPGVPKVYVTALKRTAMTAGILFPGAVQQVADGLEEMDFGVFENRTADEMSDDSEYRNWVEGGCTGRCPGGEDLAGFQQRCAAAFVRLVASAARQGEKRMVLVAHGGTLMAVMDRFSGENRDYFSWKAGNCQGWRVWLDEVTFSQTSVFQGFEAMERPGL